jgi:membrane protein involved in D-alanine export
VTPFASFLYFGLLLYVVVPALIARGFNVKPRHVILPTTLVMVVVQYGLGPTGLALAPWRDIGKVLGFTACELVVAAAFLRARLAGHRRYAFYAAVALALVPLALEKFLPRDAASVVGFLGISYLTFRALDVIFVIQDGLVKELPAGEYVAFLLFFPAISAGPIDRYRRFRTDYRRERSRDELLADLDRAVERIFRGLLYSFVIGRLIDFYWLMPLSRETGVRATVEYMYAYSMYLFFDFAGYSAFAIGVGYLFGVRMNENFNKPFLAKNIVEFWNRWHISLSTWLRDHVYGRFVMAATKGRWFKDRQLSGYLGTLLAFGLMGVWHGTATHYIAYGLYHAVLLAGYGILTQPGRRRRFQLPPLVAQVVTFHVVCFGFLMFSGRLF